MSGRRLKVRGVAALERAELAEQLSWCGATAAAGVPTTVPDGLHLLAVTNDEIRAGLALGCRDPAATVVDARAFATPERVALYKAGAYLVALHASDATVPDGYLPEQGETAATNFGQAIAVAGGYAIGHLLLVDGSVKPGEPVTSGYVPVFGTVANAWVAHRHRRAGIARALLEHARAAYPLVELQRPFTPAGAGWAAACAPDLVDVGRNSRCPCGSGAKFKRCHGIGRAA